MTNGRHWVRTARTLGAVVALALTTVSPQTAHGFGFTGEWGASGSADGQFDFTANAHQDAAADSAGNVWVVDGANARVQKFSPTGGFLQKIGTAGADAGQFAGITDVAVDAVGNVWVLDATRVKVLKFGADGTFVDEFGTPGNEADVGTLNNPNGLDVDAAGNIYVVDPGRQRIVKYDATGGFLTEAAAYGTDVVVSSSNVWVAAYYEDRVVRFTTALESPTAFGATGTGTDEFQFPISIAVDGAGRVIVADSGNERLVRLQPSGAWLDTITGCCGGANWNLQGVGAAGGDLYVTNKTTSGTIRDTVVRFATQPPTAAFSWDPAQPLPGQGVTFTASSNDADGTVVAHAWDFDSDGQFDDGSGASATWTFSAAGSATVRLAVTDDDGATTIASATVTIRAPEPTATPSGTANLPAGVQPATIQPAAIEKVCVAEEKRTIKKSIVRGCFKSSGTLLTSDQDIEVDGVILRLPEGSSDSFVIDTSAGTVKTKNSSTRIEAVTRMPTGEEILGLIVRTGEQVLYRLDAGVKASLEFSRNVVRGISLFPSLVSGVIRSDPVTNAVGDVVAEGKATILALFGLAGDFVAPITANDVIRGIDVNRFTWRNPAAVVPLGGFGFEAPELRWDRTGLRIKTVLNLPLLVRLNTEIAATSTGIEAYVRASNVPIFVPVGISTFGTVRQVGLDGRIGGGSFTFGGQIDLNALVAVLPMHIAGAASLTASAKDGFDLHIPNAQFDPLSVADGKVAVTLRGGLRIRRSLWSGSLTVGVVGPTPVQSFNGTLSGWLHKDSHTFAFEGPVNLSLLGTASSIVSNIGHAACANIDVAGVKISAGIAGTWDKPPTLLAAGCDIGPYRPADPTAGAAQASGARSFSLPAGLPAASIAVDGSGAAPDVVLSGPGGAARTKVLTDGSTTHILVARPAAGNWTITPRDGSAAITAVRVASGLPEPDVRAQVTGRGHRRVLRYSVVPQRGQVVRFVEVGGDVVAPIGTAKGRRGALRFTPGLGRGGRRSIVALVEQDGTPRENRTVARYAAPGPERLRAVGRVRLTRTRTGMRASWRKVRGAARYDAVLRLAGRPPVTFTVSAPRLALPALDARTSATLRVTAHSRDGRSSKPATGRLRPARRR